MVPGRLGLLVTLLLVLFNLSTEVSSTIPRSHFSQNCGALSNALKVRKNLPSDSLDLVERRLCCARLGRVLPHPSHHQVPGGEGTCRSDHTMVLLHGRDCQVKIEKYDDKPPQECSSLGKEQD